MSSPAETDLQAISVLLFLDQTSMSELIIIFQFFSGSDKDDEDADKIDEELMDEEDEELDEGTDYANNFFDNGENYLDDDEDNLDEGGIY